MKVSDNFDIREFVSPDTWRKWGERSIWFVDPVIIEIAEFYREFFCDYYGADEVNVIVNDWHFGGRKIGRGYREPKQYNSGQFSKRPNSESLHRQGKAFDCDIYLKMNGESKEVDYRAVHAIIKTHQFEFRRAGVTTLEHPEFAKTWLHTDVRYTGLDHILIVKP